MLDNNIIRFDLQALFLGLTFDNHLHWTNHLKTLRTKCYTSLNVLKMINNKNYSPPNRIMLSIYRTTVRNKIDYGSIICRSTSQTRLQILDPVHHTGIRLCLGTFTTSPTASILTLAGEPPLTIRRQILNLTYCSTLLKNPIHPNIKLDGLPTESVFSRYRADLATFNLERDSLIQLPRQKLRSTIRQVACFRCLESSLAGSTIVK